MAEPGDIIVGVLGQWASGKTEAARTLLRHLGGAGDVVFLADRVLFASQALDHILGLENSHVAVSIEEDGRQRLDGKLASVWQRPGEDLKTVDPGSLNFDVYDDQVLVAWRKRAKVELGHQIRRRSEEGKPIVIEAAFGPNIEPAGENLYGRTTSSLFVRLEGAGVEPSRVKWIIVEARYGTRSARNDRRQDSIAASHFQRFGADGGDMDPGQENRLVEQGTLIRRVPNEPDSIDRFRGDIIAAVEGMFGRAPLARTVSGKRVQGHLLRRSGSTGGRAAVAEWRAWNAA